MLAGDGSNRSRSHLLAVVRSTLARGQVVLAPAAGFAAAADLRAQADENGHSSPIA